MADFETIRYHWVIEFAFCGLADKGAQFALIDCFEKGTDFLLFAAYLHLDATIKDVSHPTDGVEAFGDVPD
jgi:hypothetical protein